MWWLSLTFVSFPLFPLLLGLFVLLCPFHSLPPIYTRKWRSKWPFWLSWETCRTKRDHLRSQTRLDCQKCNGNTQIDLQTNEQRREKWKTISCPSFLLSRDWLLVSIDITIELRERERERHTHTFYIPSPVMRGRTWWFESMVVQLLKLKLHPVMNTLHPSLEGRILHNTSVKTLRSWESQSVQKKKVVVSLLFILLFFFFFSFASWTQLIARCKTLSKTLVQKEADASWVSSDGYTSSKTTVQLNLTSLCVWEGILKKSRTKFMRSLPTLPWGESYIHSSVYDILDILLQEYVMHWVSFIAFFSDISQYRLQHLYFMA